MASDGISRLVAVTTMKTDNANDDALQGADKQRDLVNNQRLVRQRQQKVDEYLRDKNLTDEEYWNVRDMLLDSGLSDDGVDGSWDGVLGYFEEGHAGEVGHWDAPVGGEVDNDLATENEKKMDSVKQRLEGAMKDLEAEDRLGNFEIQRLMSQYNQSEQLASSVQKKVDDTSNAVIGKVG